MSLGQRRAAVAITVVMSALVSCDSPLPPSSTAIGEFDGNAGLHFLSLTICIAQAGAALAGTARLVDGDSVIFAGVPVLISYPALSFTYTSPTLPQGYTFTGNFQQDGTIKGQGRAGTGAPSNITLARGPSQFTGGCN